MAAVHFNDVLVVSRQFNDSLMSSGSLQSFVCSTWFDGFAA